MKYAEYPGLKTYVVFHTEGTGEQGGAPIVEKEIIGDFDTLNEAVDFGRKRYPRITGWEWDNCTININTLTDKGQEELVIAAEKFAEIENDMKANPHLYITYQFGETSITLKHNEVFDGPLPKS